MIPPMLLTPIAKYVGIGLALASLWGWGYLTGRSHVKQAWDASIAIQAMQTANQVIAEAKMSNEVLKEHAKDMREAETKVDVLEREVIRYVQAPDKPCSVDPEFVRLFDELSRLPGLGPDRVPTADASAGDPVVSPEADLTTTQVLQAYQRAAEELMWLWLDYDALVQWERGRFIVQQAQQEPK